MRTHLSILSVALLLLGGSVRAVVGAESSGQAAQVASKPNIAELTFASVATNPAKVELLGPAARFSLLVEGRTADGRVLDLTHLAKYKSRAEQLVSVDSRGVLRGVADGSAEIEVAVAGQTLLVPVFISGSQERRQLSFLSDVEPLLNRFGCNTSGCHGKAEGQNGFKLSVFGFDPKADYQALIMEGRGRRVFPADPTRSLLLAKATGMVAHGGGVRIRPGSAEYELLHDWIGLGVPFGTPEEPHVTQLELTPKKLTARFQQTQQLRAIATYSDGRRADVTHLARFQANNALVAVDEQGLVSFGETPGQAAVMGTFAGSVDTFQVILPRAAAATLAQPAAENNLIDKFINARLAQLNIAPSAPGTDADFQRRAYLDIIGRLPTALESRTFLTDNSPGKRVRLVDELLVRPEYADYWALYWSDLLRVDRQALGHKSAYAYYRWIQQSLSANKPLDVWTRELLTAEGPLSEVPQGNFYKVVKSPGERAATVSQVFLGIRISCAECHHHPWDRWGQDDYYGMLSFFQQVHLKGATGEETLVAEGNQHVTQPRSGETIYPYLLGTQKPAAAAPWMEADRRQELAAQLTSPKNPWFARNMANRIFAQFMGQGLIEPVDDMRDTNPPQNPELLDALANHLIASNFDAHALIRLITASAAYQRSPEPNETNLEDEQNFSRALFRRVPAEVLYDAVSDVTGIGEKFDGVPAGARAVQLWDSRVSHTFLKLFGRPLRTSACQCERVVEPSMAQVLHMLNSANLAEKLAHPAGRVAGLAASKEENDKLAEELYLTFFSRFPTAEERQLATEHLAAAGPNRQAAAEDLAWTMLNSLEFVFNH